MIGLWKGVIAIAALMSFVSVISPASFKFALLPASPGVCSDKILEHSGWITHVPIIRVRKVDIFDCLTMND